MGSMKCKENDLPFALECDCVGSIWSIGRIWSTIVKCVATCSTAFSPTSLPLLPGGSCLKTWLEVMNMIGDFISNECEYYDMIMKDTKQIQRKQFGPFDN